VDHRTDIFSFGIVLFEMACGSRPFKGDSWGDLASAILRDDPPSIGELRVDLPRHLGRILRHCMEKDVQRRFQTMLDLRNELADLQHELISGELPSGGGSGFVSLQKRPRPGRIAVWTAIAIGVAAALGYVGTQQAPEQDAVVEPQPAITRILVLPFENLGPPEEAYFAAGIAEEISSRMARISSLQVVSRQSFQEGETSDALFMLEGTVRWDTTREPARVRVTPRLVSTVDGSQLWSQSYERVIEDIFAVQSEIASEVIDQMDVALLETEKAALAGRPTVDVAAYRAYLQGMKLAGRRNPSSRHWREAQERFERAVELDPSFATAWAELSEVHSLAAQIGIDRSQGDIPHIEAALEAAERALTIDPDLPEAHRALAYYHYWCHRDYDRALTAFNRAAESIPNDPQVVAGQAFVWRRD